MTELKISIVIPVYNEKTFVRELISRVEATDYNKEIILVDDFSTAGSRERTPVSNGGLKKSFGAN